MSPNIQHKLRNNTLTSMLSYAEHLTEIEVNKLQKYFYQNQILVYYFLVRLGISTSLRYSDLSHIIWEYLLGRDFLAIREQKTNRAREMPLNLN
ncbi:MAG: hypothetical protein IPP73_10300 [Chitinophagaceae bacterium]|nr:hypothetical protein [Chitinophagaceae bacterium]